MIVVTKKNGIIQYQEREIIIFIEEQLKMIPGIHSLGNTSFIDKIRHVLSLQGSGVKISQLNKNELFLELSVVLNKDINYLEIEDEIKKIISYSLKKKYGLDVTGIDIYICDLV